MLIKNKKILAKLPQVINNIAKKNMLDTKDLLASIRESISTIIRKQRRNTKNSFMGVIKKSYSLPKINEESKLTSPSVIKAVRMKIGGRKRKIEPFLILRSIDDFLKKSFSYALKIMPKAKRTKASRRM